MNTGALTIKELYPDLEGQQLKEAEENLEQYLALVLCIYNRASVDPESYQQLLSLTNLEKGSTIPPERSNLKKPI